MEILEYHVVDENGRIVHIAKSEHQADRWACMILRQTRRLLREKKRAEVKYWWPLFCIFSIEQAEIGDQYVEWQECVDGQRLVHYWEANKRYFLEDTTHQLNTETFKRIPLLENRLVRKS